MPYISLLSLSVLTLLWQTACSLSVSQVTLAQWQTLNQTVGGRLHAGTPMALPCFLRYDNGSGQARLNTPNAATCSAVNSGKTDGPTIASYFGGYQVPNWGQCVAKSQSCTISALLPVDPVTPLLQTCYQGSVPSFYIDCQQASDVQAGLAFAQNHSLPLVIKNTGHDHRGRSSGPNTFALWTHNIKANPQINTAFTPSGCKTTDAALTYGAGSEFGDLYDYVHQHGYMLVGGASKSVGASGGWLMGGGHGALVNSYGLGVDNVLQMKVVLPNGQLITANRCQNTDIFFALRGGGGGTFGVVLETTSKIYKEVPMQSVSIAFGHLSLDQGSKYLQILIDNAPRWASEGWGGYILPGLLDGTASTFAAITPKLTLDQAKASMKPVIDFANSLPNLNVPLQASVTTLPHGYYDFLQTPSADLVGGFTGLSYSLVSRLVPQSLFTSNSSKSDLHSTLMTLVSNRQPNPAVPFYILMVTPAAYKLPDTDLPGGPGASSVTPAWRNSLWQFVMPALWDPNDPTASGAGSVNQAFTNAHNALQPLRDLTPSSGAYQNEADVFEPNPEATFWGQDNYAKLLQIKQKIDPANILTCWNCIGWNPQDARYACYPRLT